MGKNTKGKENGSGVNIFDALFEVILTVFVYTARIIRSIVGMFLRN